jgi:hypothetical protein
MDWVARRAGTNKNAIYRYRRWPSRAALAVADDPELLAQLRERAGDAGSATWLTILGRAVAHGEAAPG